jgi:cytochrome oxidase Cu insertion factor (SCO1/SenC/PrrC family)
MKAPMVTAILALAMLTVGCAHEQVAPGHSPIDVGDPAPPFSLHAADGSIVSLSEFAGKPVLLYFSMGPG